MTLRDSRRVVVLAGALLLSTLPASPVLGGEGAEGLPEPKPSQGVFAAGIDKQVPRPKPDFRKPLIQHRNPFKLELTRDQLPKDASGLSEILVQRYDAEAGKWKGYGLMALKRERLESGGTRIAGATLDFVAPTDGIYCLRTVARYASGRIDSRSPGLDQDDVEWMVVLDRTPPKVTITSPASRRLRLKPGSRVAIGWKVDEDYPAHRVELEDSRTGEKKTVDAHRVEISHDGGNTWKFFKGFRDPRKRIFWSVEGPNTDSLLVRVTVRDAAGNVGSGTSKRMAVAGFKHTADAFDGKGRVHGPLPSVARRTYQRGVIYMTRGEYPDAARHLEEAIRLDKKLLRAYVDLSATYLRLHERQLKITGQPNSTYLAKGKQCCTDAFKAGFEKEAALHYNLAQFVWRQKKGNEEAAIKCLKEGLAHNPRHVESLYFMAYLRWHQRDAAYSAGRGAEEKRLRDEAKKLWKQAAALGGVDHPHAKQAVHCLRLLEKWERAMEERAARKETRKKRIASGASPSRGDQ